MFKWVCYFLKLRYVTWVKNKSMLTFVHTRNLSPVFPCLTHPTTRTSAWCWLSSLCLIPGQSCTLKRDISCHIRHIRSDLKQDIFRLFGVNTSSCKHDTDIFFPCKVWSLCFQFRLTLHRLLRQKFAFLDAEFLLQTLSAACCWAWSAPLRAFVLKMAVFKRERWKLHSAAPEHKSKQGAESCLK